MSLFKNIFMKSKLAEPQKMGEKYFLQPELEKEDIKHFYFH